MSDFNIKECINFRKECQQMSYDIVDEYEANLRKSGRYATGKLERSLKPYIKYVDDGIEIWLRLNDYYKYIEAGRSGKGMSATKEDLPPIHKIEEWVIAKRLPTGSGKKGDLPTPTQLAWKVAWKIARFGFEGSFDLKAAAEKIMGNYKQRLQEALEKDIDNYVVKLVNEYDSIITWN